MTEQPHNPPVPDLSLGQYLRQARKRKGLSLRELAELTGRDRGHISRLENGERARPSLEVLHSLAVALDVDYRRLVVLSGQAVPETLPALTDYLRAKYNLDEATARKLAGQFRQVVEQHKGKSSPAGQTGA